MKKHKKILKNFNFKTMVKAAIKDSSELAERIKRFNHWKCCKISEELEWNKARYCFIFNFVSALKPCKTEIDSTECEKKFIGNYLHKNFTGEIPRYFNLRLGVGGSWIEGFKNKGKIVFLYGV